MENSTGDTWLEQERGIKMNIWGVYYWLKKLKAKLKVPRKTHAKQDPEEMEAFKQNIVDKLNEFEIPDNQRVRVWVEDEHRYGLISVVRRDAARPPTKGPLPSKIPVELCIWSGGSNHGSNRVFVSAHCVVGLQSNFLGTIGGD